MWWWFASAWAGPIAGDPASAWDGARYWLQSEQIEAMALVVPGHPVIAADAVQLELLLGCVRIGPRRAACAIDDAALRAATRDQWQRPADRDAVQAALGDARDALIGRALRVSTDARGDLTKAEDHGIGADSRLLDLVRVAGGALGTIGRPTGPPTESWWRPGHLLMRLADPDAARSGDVLHQGAWVEGQLVVETVGAARAHGTGPRTDLIAVSAYDAVTGALTERVFDVVSEVGRGWEHSGQVLRLGPGDRPTLGDTGQVAPPGEPRLSLPEWASMRRIGVEVAP